MFSWSRNDVVALCVAAVGLLLAAFFVSSAYYQLIVSLVAIWALFAVGWNVFSGLSGMVSFGHAIFFGLGAYTTALMATKLDVTPLVGIPVGCLVAIAAALVIGRITFGLRGHYFALAMLTFPISAMYCAEWLGLQEVALPLRRENAGFHLQFGDPRVLTLVNISMLLLAVALALCLQKSRFGLALQALRQNEAAAEASGLSAFRLRMVAIAISAGLAGLAGGLYCLVMLVVTPHSVLGMHVSAQALIISMFGGVGTVWGPLLGAAVLVPLTEILYAEFGAALPGVQGVMLGAAIIAVMLFMPAGLVRSFKSRGTDRIVSKIPSAQQAGASGSLWQGGSHQVSQQVLFECSDIAVRFGGNYALRGVSFDAKKGEIIGVVGPNGAGKTTLFNVLSGFVKPSGGRAVFDGRQLIGQKPDAIARLGIGRTFQVARPFPEMTVFENVLVGCLASKLGLEQAFQITTRMAGELQLGSKLGAETEQLSNFELRLVELARALAASPRLILLDEPFAGVASSEIIVMSDLLTELGKAGFTVIIIDHTVPALRKFVDRIIVLDHGEIIANGLPDDVLADPEVKAAYLGTDTLAHADM
ncbi:MAG: branched-chain amino acid ABC transporter ATP-binding protein/permease [Bosea sp.]|uniref:branched-chain amino acid ABC transporter ATP-binding protein/permease n=1 Tax=Bosea sp. (in: a-proteobacteria) TaxID=1871050 RepID=UPI001ACFBB34|nr:branched-chain amino acid ABC transporter ATP-binding protein/permease [Bosea sp. (in: a-proteobacteria)]MBN9467175.1 branched-chain amino acid ABC transporter ATP-binding protein/permease [Bosea sp. (in: a-proteobacteria)]